MHKQTGPCVQWNTPRQEKEKELLRHTTTRLYLRCIILRESGHTQRATCCTIPFPWRSCKGKVVGIDNRSVVAGDWGWGRGWLQRNTAEGILGDVELFSILIVAAYVCQNSRKCTQRRINLTLRASHLHKKCGELFNVLEFFHATFGITSYLESYRACHTEAV